MSNKLWKLLLASPAVLGMGLAGSAIAAETPSVESLEMSQESVELAQVTSVDELTDVLPTDWAYTALQNLVEQYGCIEGYPNRTFRGNQPLSRYEFAAGLNACLEAIVFALQGGGIPEGELATIQRLQEEFAAELATLRGRVDALEADVAELRAQQFSTTAKLRGQVDANLVVPFDSLETAVLNAAGNRVLDDTDNFTTFDVRARLNFDASFTGDDRLRVRLQAGDNANALAAAGGLANEAGGGLDVGINDFYYSFPIGGRIDAIIAANSIATNDFVVSTIVPFDGPAVADAGKPQLYDAPGLGGGGFGAGLSFSLTDNIVLDAGYSADQGGSNNPDGGGIFGASSQSYIGQLSFLSDGLFDGALVYEHGTNRGIVNDTFGGLVNFDFGALMLAGYFAFHEYENAAEDDDTSWQVGVAFPDLFLEGSQLGVYYTDFPATVDNDPHMIEGYYAVPVNQFLTLTPALIYGDLDLDGIDSENFYGAIRATFEF